MAGMPMVPGFGKDEQLAQFSRQLLEEACLAVARDMDSYDYHIARLLQKVALAIEENPSWAREESRLRSLIRAAATGFGGRRQTVWLASFECCLDPVAPGD